MLAPMVDIRLGSALPVKILQSGFYWSTLFKDCTKFVKPCDSQRVGNIGKRNEMHMNYSLPLEPFDV
jgi:hypothetical protein